jgi:hypothetical protein
MMMDGMTSGMMWGMGLFWLLAIIVLLLAAAALMKYLRSNARAACRKQSREADRHDGSGSLHRNPSHVMPEVSVLLLADP